jgi:hypothetical protein
MYKSFSFSILLFVSSTSLFAQSLDTIWTKCIGGALQEVTGTVQLNNPGMDMVSVCNSNDGGYFVASYGNYSDGYFSSNAGDIDGFLSKLNANGDTLWTRILGGSGFDKLFKVKTANGGGCYVVGQTYSNNGYFTLNQGLGDGFISKYTETGALVWKRTYGGSSSDALYDLVESQAGNVVAVGESISSDGDLVGTGAGYCWVLTVNGNTGNLIASRIYVGPNGNNPDALENYSLITETANGSGFIVSGFTGPDFNNFNLDNIQVAKIGSDGTKLWETEVGSSTGRDGSSSIINTANGSFYITGWLGGSGGQASSYLGGSADAWLIYFDANGDLIWEKNYGGTNFEFFSGGEIGADNNLYLSGFTRSLDSLLTSTTPSGLWDFWVVKTNGTTGDFIDQLRIGGASNDVCLGISPVNQNNEFLLVGFTDSNEGFVHGNNGGRDIWVTKIKDNSITTGMANNKENRLKLYPNPATEILNIYGLEEADVNSITIFDALGKKQIVSSKYSDDLISVNVKTLNSGFYNLIIDSKLGTFISKLSIIN